MQLRRSCNTSRITHITCPACPDNEQAILKVEECCKEYFLKKRQKHRINLLCFSAFCTILHPSSFTLMYVGFEIDSMALFTRALALWLIGTSCLTLYAINVLIK